LKSAGINSLEKYNFDPQPQPSSLSLHVPENYKKALEENQVNNKADWKIALK
jgi:hypothetical protein